LKWLAFVLLGACAPTTTPSAPDGEDEEPPEAVATTAPQTRPGDLCALPIIVRCLHPNNGCTLAVRARRRDGVLELLTPSTFFRDDAPVVLDADNVYWPGSAVTKRDLTAIELDWRSTRVRWLDQRGSDLVVVDEQGAYLLPKDGSPRRSLVDAVAIWSAAVGPSFVGWTLDHGSAFPGKNKVVIADHGGAVLHEVIEESPYGLRIFGDVALWYAFGQPDPANPTGAIRRLAGDRAITLAGGQYAPRDLTVDGDHVYWVTDEDAGRIVRRARLDGGEVERLGASHEMSGHRNNLDHIVVQGDHVYWNAAHSVVRAPKDGGTAQMVVTVDVPGDIVGFAVDDTHVYLTAHVYATTPR
jgi:hypothetical protein